MITKEKYFIEFLKKIVLSRKYCNILE